MKQRIRLIALLSTLLSAACADDFASYNDLQGVRVLAMAADKPEVLPGESTTLSALVTGDASYSWSWCPFAGTAEAGYPCAIRHDEMQAMAEQLAGPDIVIPDFDLGTGKTAVLPHSVPPAFYRDICEVLIAGSVPDGYDVPDCDDRFEVQVQLVVTFGGKSIAAVSTLEFLLDPAVTPNQNPTLGGVYALGPDGTEVELDPETPTQLNRETAYGLTLDIDESSSEFYASTSLDGRVDSLERLSATWFYQGGKIDKEISSYFPGDAISTIDSLRTNTWEPPSAAERPESSALLHFVIRDGRGGVTWLSREIELVTL